MTTHTMSIQREKIYIRPVQESDQSALEALVSEIWDGHDYLPKVFQQWLNDENGYFDVLTYENTVIGVAKLTQFTDQEWWLEGLRIDPRYQGQGLARILHHYKVNQARQLGNGVLRFSTSSQNEAMQKLATETGFSVVSEFHYMTLPTIECPLVGLQLLRINDINQVQTWLDNSAYFQQTDRSFETTWKWQVVTPELLTNYLSNEQVYGWFGGNDTNQLQGLVVIDQIRESSDDSTFYLAYADAEDLANFWPAVQGLAHQRNAQRISTKILNDAQYVQPIVVCGGVWKELNVSLFSRPLTMTVHSDIQHVQMPVVN